MQPPAGPLTGLRVVELAGLGPAPYACMLLAELGADVIRVDRPGRRLADRCPGEGRPQPRPAQRRRRPQVRRAAGRSCSACSTRADVLVEGLRPGVLERLGLGPDEAWPATPGWSTRG